MQGQKTGTLPPGGQRFHLFQVANALRFADLRIASLAPIMYRLRTSGEGARRYGIVDWSPVDFQIAAPGASQDYSAARGMADAVFDLSRNTGDSGVCAHSSRADLDSGLVVESHGDSTGGLIFAIFGRDSTVVPALEAVKPKASFDTFEEICSVVAGTPSALPLR
jgi:hypothetical protein